MTIARPRIDCEQHHAGLAVADVRAAVEFYTTKLGFTTAFTYGDPPTFAGVLLDRVQIFLQQGTPNPGASSIYFMVGDADELFAFHQANGVDVLQPPTDQDYEIRDYVVRDLHGYHLSFGHRLSLADGPPLPIERVAVPVRLEKRLAALLDDLATHKRMTVSSCLDSAAHQRAARRRRRQPAYAADAALHPGTEEEARHRLRQPRQLPLRRALNGAALLHKKCGRSLTRDARRPYSPGSPGSPAIG
jgi:catechol 2,3-dioxygenase-like lactoylglutathione lyase family enzyme